MAAQLLQGPGRKPRGRRTACIRRHCSTAPNLENDRYVFILLTLSLLTAPKCSEFPSKLKEVLYGPEWIKTGVAIQREQHQWLMLYPPPPR